MDGSVYTLFRTTFLIAVKKKAILTIFLDHLLQASGHNFFMLIHIIRGSRRDKPPHESTTKGYRLINFRRSSR